MMLRAAVLLCSVALAIGASLDGKIVGGLPADILDFPYQVSFRYYDDHLCGASILNKNTVLTAAHCTDGLSANHMTIRVGNTNNNFGKEYLVYRYIQHPEYNSQTYDKDICILKLVDNLVFGPGVQPISMIATGSEVQSGSLAVVSGWGDEWEGADLTPDNLRMVRLNVISDDRCKDYYGINRISRNMLCAKTPNKDSCQGDSGGPFVYNNKLIGVVSWGIGCARPNYAGVYTKLSVMRPWVESNM